MSNNEGKMREIRSYILEQIKSADIQIFSGSMGNGDISCQFQLSYKENLDENLFCRLEYNSFSEYGSITFGFITCHYSSSVHEFNLLLERMKVLMEDYLLNNEKEFESKMQEYYNENNYGEERN